MKTIVQSVFIAFFSLWLVFKAQAVSPAPDGGYPGGNTAEGQNALFSRTTGGYNTALGFWSLLSDTTGSLNTATGAGALLANTGDKNTAIGAGVLLNNTTGAENTASGAFALVTNTTGSDNTANGVNALESNTTGADNTANGVNALQDNSTGVSNTADGVGALETNTDGTENTASGVAALEDNTHGSQNTATGVNALLSNTTGGGNTAIGHAALFSNTTGNGNIALGVGAGLEVTTGNNNIHIGSNGIAGDSNVIRIGNDQHTSAYIAGVAGQTVGAGGTTCYVDNSGKLGVFLSARRYKENIERMNGTSTALFSLKPVTFRYKPEVDNSGTPQFGLIAEEVAAVNPDLVVRNAKGELSTVRYEAVNVMLLNEFLKEHKAFVQEQHKVEKLEANAAEQQKQIEALSAGLQKLSAHVGLSKAAPQTALNNQ